MLFDAHTRSFAALGGVPRRGIYDNMKTAVDKVNKGKGRIVNARIAVMCAHYLFDADFCNVASGWGKGVVEKNAENSHSQSVGVAFIQNTPNRLTPHRPQRRLFDVAQPQWTCAD
jgi:transposase